MEKELYDEVQQAFDLGKKAFKAGRMPVPDFDKELMTLIGDRINNNTGRGKRLISSFMDQWSNGWAIGLSSKQVTAVFSESGVNQFVISVTNKEDLTYEMIKECINKHFNGVSKIVIDSTAAFKKVKVYFYNTSDITILDWAFLLNY